MIMMAIAAYADAAAGRSFKLCIIFISVFSGFTATTCITYSMTVIHLKALEKEVWLLKSSEPCSDSSSKNENSVIIFSSSRGLKDRFRFLILKTQLEFSLLGELPL